VAYVKWVAPTVAVADIRGVVAHMAPRGHRMASCCPAPERQRIY
jgi:hypothetical protein